MGVGGACTRALSVAINHYSFPDSWEQAFGQENG
jgi:hypothetical protein